MDLLSLYKDVLNAKYTTIDDETASYAYQKEDDGTLYLYFEQSNGSTDWKNNLDFFAKPYKDMEHTWHVHRGFLRVWKVIEDKLADIIADESVKQIIIAGYSHGAALALLCHEYCVYHRPDITDNIQGYGYGCPRVVWGYLPKAVKKRFDGFSVVRNKKDLVTHLPPAIFLYRHVGELLTIGDGKAGWIDAHKANNYIDSLQSYFESEMVT